MRYALAEHERKLAENDLSLPSKIGKLVIVVSNRTFKHSDYPIQMQRDAFHAEAEDIAERRMGQYGGIEIRREALAPGIALDLADKEVSDMVMIGHGAIDSLWLDSGGSLRWRTVAKYAKYLKQGGIEQRMCGHFNGFDAVPMGTFALSDQRNLVASVGAEIDDINPDESLFRRVYDKERITASDITALISDHEDQFMG